MVAFELSTTYLPQDTVLMLYVYPKNEQSDLTLDQIKAIKAIVDHEFP